MKTTPTYTQYALGTALAIVAAPSTAAIGLGSAALVGAAKQGFFGFGDKPDSLLPEPESSQNSETAHDPVPLPQSLGGHPLPDVQRSLNPLADTCVEIEHPTCSAKACSGTNRGKAISFTHPKGKSPLWFYKDAAGRTINAEKEAIERVSEQGSAFLKKHLVFPEELGVGDIVIKGEGRLENLGQFSLRDAGPSLTLFQAWLQKPARPNCKGLASKMDTIGRSSMVLLKVFQELHKIGISHNDLHIGQIGFDEGNKNRLILTDLDQAYVNHGRPGQHIRATKKGTVSPSLHFNHYKVKDLMGLSEFFSSYLSYCGLYLAKGPLRDTAEASHSVDRIRALVPKLEGVNSEFQALAQSAMMNAVSESRHLQGSDAFFSAVEEKSSPELYQKMYNRVWGVLKESSALLKTIASQVRTQLGCRSKTKKK